MQVELRTDHTIAGSEALIDQVNSVVEYVLSDVSDRFFLKSAS